MKLIFISITLLASGLMIEAGLLGGTGLSLSSLPGVSNLGKTVPLNKLPVLGEELGGSADNAAAPEALGKVVDKVVVDKAGKIGKKVKSKQEDESSTEIEKAAAPESLANNLKKVRKPVKKVESTSEDEISSDIEMAAAPEALGKGKKKGRSSKIDENIGISQKRIEAEIPSFPTPKPGEKYNFGPPILGIGEDDTALKESLCEKGDDSCLDNMVQAEPETPKSIKDKLKEKLALERKYDQAMKEGEIQAVKENAANGGPPPFGGLQLPDWDQHKAEPVKNYKSKTKGGKPRKTDEDEVTTPAASDEEPSESILKAEQETSSEAIHKEKTTIKEHESSAATNEEHETSGTTAEEHASTQHEPTEHTETEHEATKHTKIKEHLSSEAILRADEPEPDAATAPDF